MIRRYYFSRNISNDIRRSDIYKLINEKAAIVIDVRSNQEFSENHINGAINIPLWDVKTQIPKIVNDKKQYIIFYCSSGIRSKKAQKIISDIGYENVYNVIDGFYV